MPRRTRHPSPATAVPQTTTGTHSQHHLRATPPPYLPTINGLSPALAPLPRTLTDNKPLPKLIVFDLDYTLWPFWVDTHVSPPLKPEGEYSGSGGGRGGGEEEEGDNRSPHEILRVRDAHGQKFGFYPEVPALLSALRDRGVQIGAASRTGRPELAREMLSFLTIPLAPSASASKNDLSSFSNGEMNDEGSNGVPPSPRPAISAFDFLEIYPGSKTLHFARLQKGSGLDFQEMLFFDDETRNRNVEGLGVVMYLVRDGVSRAEFDRGVEAWRKKNGREVV